MINLTTAGYLIYLLISLGITVFVGRALNRSGLVFLLDQLGGNQRLAQAINQLLLIGFYLVNIGYILLVLNLNSAIPTHFGRAAEIDDINALIRFLSLNTGLVMLMLGSIHLILLYVLHNWKPNWASQTAEDL
jgi:hypothetical protein